MQTGTRHRKDSHAASYTTRRDVTLTGVPQPQDAGKPGCSNQACPRRRRREAAGIRAAPGRAAATAAIFTAAWKQGRILAMAKLPSRSAANAMRRQMSSRL